MVELKRLTTKKEGRMEIQKNKPTPRKNRTIVVPVDQGKYISSDASIFFPVVQRAF